jgi:hypothetical protein
MIAGTGGSVANGMFNSKPVQSARSQMIWTASGAAHSAIVSVERLKGTLDVCGSILFFFRRSKTFAALIESSLA